MHELFEILAKSFVLLILTEIITHLLERESIDFVHNELKNIQSQMLELKRENMTLKQINERQKRWIDEINRNRSS